MKIEDLQKQLEQIQSIDFKSLPPEQLEKIIEQLSTFTQTGEDLLNKEINILEDENDS